MAEKSKLISFSPGRRVIESVWSTERFSNNLLFIISYILFFYSFLLSLSLLHSILCYSGMIGFYLMIWMSIAPLTLSYSLYLLVQLYSFYRIAMVIILYIPWFNFTFLFLYFVSISADPNRVPYDLPEAESEPIAGFITEYSTIYFSLILFTEYDNIIHINHAISIVNLFGIILVLKSAVLLILVLNIQQHMVY